MARPRTLSRDRVVTAALALVEGEGLDALSMRRLAVELDTAPASLYRHIANRADLVALVGERIVDEMAADLDPQPEATWQERTIDWAGAIRAALRGRRGRVALLVGPDSPPPETYRIFQAAVDAYEDAGFPPAVAAATAQVLTFTVLSFIDLESQWPDAVRVERGALLAGWRGAGAVDASGGSNDETFEFLLRSVIAMVERRLADEV